jgi:GWxTD domain-containing protein
MQQVQKYILPILTVIFLFMAELLSAQPQRAYERGLEELYRGNTTQALDIWYNAYDRSGGLDGRIGFEFIRVVTEEEMEGYYEQATELYYKALIRGQGADSRIAVRQEINRLRPIIGEGIYRQWVGWWEENNRNLGQDMRGFWVQHDPTPSNISNERLIEHWERIAISKRRFNRDNNTVYGTDDRALVYIRYGEPDRTRNGIFTLQSFNIRNWLQNQLNPYAQQENRRDGGRPDDPEMRRADDEQLIQRLENAIYEFHRYPEYEIWFYDNLATVGDEPIPFIFGTDVNEDKFRLQTSIEDFIPSRAYNPEQVREQEGVEFTRAGITPAVMLQLLYYEQLSQVDSFFNDRLNELQDRILDQGLQAFQGMDLAFKTESRELINQRSVRAPVERSNYTEKIARIPLHVYQYRFLDEDLNPYLLTYLESTSQVAFLIDYHRNLNRSDTGLETFFGQNVLDSHAYYEVIHNFIKYDESWEVKTQKTHKPELLLSQPAMGEIPSRSIFISEHTSRANLSASVELMNYDPDSRTIHNTPFPNTLRGLGKVQLRLPQPLVSHSDTLEMADLVLGYESEEFSTEPFDFVVANDGVLPYEKTLVLHFEVYNLKRKDDETAFTQFELTYRIFPVDDDGNVDEDQVEFVLTLNFTNEHRHVTEDLEIETADLSPGLYDLRVRIIDTETGHQKERTIRFEVVD